MEQKRRKQIKSLKSSMGYLDYLHQNNDKLNASLFLVLGVNKFCYSLIMYQLNCQNCDQSNIRANVNFQNAGAPFCES